MAKIGCLKSDCSTSPVGNVDGLYKAKLTGWFSVDTNKSDSKLSLLVDGVEKAVTTPRLQRPDVHTALGLHPDCGFEFDLSCLVELIKNATVEITVIHKASGYNFGNTKILYCSGVSRHYDLLEKIFYPEYYRCKYGLLEKTNELAFRNFLFSGLYKGYSPNPWFSRDYYNKNRKVEKREGDSEIELISFLDNEELRVESPSRLLDIPYYSKNNPDLADVGSLFLHYSAFGFKEGRRGAQFILPKSIKNELDEIASIEPLVATARPHLNLIIRYPSWSQATYLPAIVSNRFEDRIKVIVCVPFISRGGADLISTFLYKAYQSKYGKQHVLLIVTDNGDIDVPEWLDQDSKILDLNKESAYNDHEERLITLNIIINQLAPEKLVNINSELLWKILDRYGMQLSSYIDIYAYLFCFDYNVNRARVGYIVDYLPHTIDYFTAVYFDNKTIINDVNKLYGFTNKQKSKLIPIYIPAADNIKRRYTDYKKERRKVLWVGRLSEQKRPDLLIDIATELAFLQFDVYGPEGNSPACSNIVSGKYPNISYCGVYNHLDELPVSDYALFLNTSEWDGIPTILIQMMAIGMPIVSSTVCGIKELLNDQRGWLIEKFDDLPSYTFTIRKVIMHRRICAVKSDEACKHANSVHNWLNFLQDLEDNHAFKEVNSIDHLQKCIESEY